MLISGMNYVDLDTTPDCWSEDFCVFNRFQYVDSASCYHSPYLWKGVWYLDSIEHTIEEIGRKCHIPEDIMVILKLKYGG